MRRSVTSASVEVAVTSGIVVHGSAARSLGYPAGRPVRGGVIGNTAVSGTVIRGSSPCPAAPRRSSSHLLLTITTTHRPATDLGYLLHKHPDRVQTLRAALRQGARLLPRGERGALHRGAAARRRPGRPGPARAPRERLRPGPVRQRPALRRLVVPVAWRIAERLRHRAGRAAARTARSWPRRRSRSRPGSPVLPVPRRRGARCARLFEPLGYAVEAAQHPARRALPRVGREPLPRPSTCAARCGCADLLTHLYVLIPVLDDEKHYWVGDDEIEKLLRHGEGWLAAHPERELIARRYLKHQRAPRRARRSRSSSEASAADAEAEPRRPSEAPSRSRSACTSSASARSLAALAASGARARARPRLRRGHAAARAAARTAFERDRRHGRLVRALERRARRLRPRPRCHDASASADRAAARLADLPRHAGCAGFDAAARRRGDRAPRPAAPGGLRARRVRVRPAGDGRRDDAERASTTCAVETLPAGRVPPPRPPLRVDARPSSRPGPSGVAGRHGYARALPAGRPRGRRASARRRRWRCSAR